RGWLLTLRLAVIAGIVVIALNPQHRTQRVTHRPSRVALLVDTSVSMRFPNGESTSSAAGPTRAEAVEQLLSGSQLIPRLQERHEVSLYTFDSGLRGPEDAFRTSSESSQNESAPAETAETARATDWKS